MSDDALATLLALTQSECARTLHSIQVGVWSLVGLAAMALVAWFWVSGKRRTEEADDQPDRLKQVENAYDKGKYETALETFGMLEVTYPKAVLIKFWQGRCYFRQDNWQSAASKFEECLRLEPYYRQSVRDYMAFIELNGLVQGVEGYLRDS
ncbi:MAG: tol-pal system YbgF family protein [Gammaproteobacteria bacterium]